MPDVDEHVPQEALDSVDLAADNAWIVEIMASELVGYLGEYHKTQAALRSAKQVGDHQRAEQLSRAEAFIRTNIAYLQWKYPGAKELAQAIMKAQAAAVTKNRQNMAV